MHVDDAPWLGEPSQTASCPDPCREAARRGIRWPADHDQNGPPGAPEGRPVGATCGGPEAREGSRGASPGVRATPAAQLDRTRPLTVVPQRYTMVRPTPQKRPPIFSVWRAEARRTCPGRPRESPRVVPRLGPGRSGPALGLTGWAGPKTASKAARRQPQTGQNPIHLVHVVGLSNWPSRFGRREVYFTLKSEKLCLLVAVKVNINGGARRGSVQAQKQKKMKF